MAMYKETLIKYLYRFLIILLLVSFGSVLWHYSHCHEHVDQCHICHFAILFLAAFSVIIIGFAFEIIFYIHSQKILKEKFSIHKNHLSRAPPVFS